MLAIIILSGCKRRRFPNRPRRSDRILRSMSDATSFKSAFHIDMRIIAAVGMRSSGGETRAEIDLRPLHVHKHACPDRSRPIDRPTDRRWVAVIPTSRVPIGQFVARFARYRVTKRGDGWGGGT